MISMNDLKYNANLPAKIFQAKGNGFIAKDDMSILVPARFIEKELVVLGEETYVLGIFMYFYKKEYAVANATAMIPISPDETKHIKVDGEDCLEFKFAKGSLCIVDKDVVKNDKLLYYIYNEILSRGNVPPYFDYLTLGKVFDNAKYYTGVKLASSVTVMHLLISLVSRDSRDMEKYFRQTTNGNDYDKAEYVGIRSVTHGATNDVARIMGGYFPDKITTAMTSNNTKVENIEMILRD